MDTIKSYLDNMFLGMENNSKVTKAKAELLTMMEDKYQELKKEGKSENEAIGIVISEFGNLDEIADDLDIRNETVTKENIKMVESTSAKEYVNVSKEVFKKIGLGVGLIILSLIAIYAMIIIQQFKLVALTEDQAAIIGVTIFFVFAALGVLILIKHGSALAEFEWLKKEKFNLAYDAKQEVMTIKASESKVARNGIAVGVTLCILSVVPVVLLGGLFPFEEQYALIGVLIMFVILSLAVNLIIRSLGAYHACKVLLQEGEYHPVKK